MTIKNITGKTFGLLTVTSYHGKSNHNKPRLMWLCQCKCGNTIIRLGQTLVSGHTKSCGCLRKNINYKHGHNTKRNRTREYNTWNHMLQRCNNDKNPCYKHYGARGIKVCDRWSDFINFIKDMGERPQGTSLERIDNNGNYEPSNCEWATKIDQMNNTRRNKYYKVQGEIYSPKEISIKFSIPLNRFYSRIFRGWQAEDAAKIPFIPNTAKKH